MGKVALLYDPLDPRFALESASSYLLQNRSPLQNLDRASLAIPLEKLLAQAHSLRLLEQQSSE